MPLTHAITHQIDSSLQQGHQLRISGHQLVIGDLLDGLVARLKGSFLGRISREHGSFEGDGLLPAQLKALMANTSSFEQMSCAVAEGFQQQLVAEGEQFSAHLMFCIEEGMNSHFMHLFVVQSQQAMQINEQLEIAPIDSIDTGASLFGIKVDLREWREHAQYAYLSLLPPRGNPSLTQLFYKLCGFKSGIDKAEATYTFLEGVDAYATTLPQAQVESYKNQVVGYCMEQEGQDTPVDLAQLARSIEGINPSEFVTTMEGYQPIDSGAGIPMDRRSLSRYLRYAGRERDLSISFTSSQLSERIRYDVGSDTLHIKGLPKALRQQLLAHLQEE